MRKDSCRVEVWLEGKEAAEGDTGPSRVSCFLGLGKGQGAIGEW